MKNKLIKDWIIDTYNEIKTDAKGTLAEVKVSARVIQKNLYSDVGASEEMCKTFVASLINFANKFKGYNVIKYLNNNNNNNNNNNKDVPAQVFALDDITVVGNLDKFVNRLLPNMNEEETIMSILSYAVAFIKLFRNTNSSLKLNQFKSVDLYKIIDLDKVITYPEEDVPKCLKKLLSMNSKQVLIGEVEPLVYAFLKALASEGLDVESEQAYSCRVLYPTQIIEADLCKENIEDILYYFEEYNLSSETMDNLFRLLLRELSKLDIID